MQQKQCAAKPMYLECQHHIQHPHVPSVPAGLPVLAERQAEAAPGGCLEPFSAMVAKSHHSSVEIGVTHTRARTNLEIQKKRQRDRGPIRIR